MSLKEIVIGLFYLGREDTGNFQEGPLNQLAQTLSNTKDFIISTTDVRNNPCTAKELLERIKKAGVADKPVFTYAALYLENYEKRNAYVLEKDTERFW